MADAPGAPPPGADAAPEYHDPPPGTPVAKLMASPVDFDFGTVNTGTAARTNPVVIMNVGDAQSAPLQANLSSGIDLKLTTNCMGLRLKPGETCVVTATFDPKSVGVQMASGSVTDNSGTSFGVVTFMVKATGRLGPDAGLDTAPPVRMDAAMDAATPPDLGKDVGPDLAPKPDTMAPPDLGSADHAGAGG
jgi:hypothetical protein